MCSCGCRQEAARLDFCDPPELPDGAFAKGTKQQTCLASSSAAAATLRPKLARYEVGVVEHPWRQQWYTLCLLLPEEEPWGAEQLVVLLLCMYKLWCQHAWALIWSRARAWHGECRSPPCAGHVSKSSHALRAFSKPCVSCNLLATQASSFAHLFCNPGATAAHYIAAGSGGLGAAAGSSRPGPYSTPGKREYTTELDMEAAADVADGDVGAGWGGWDDGGEDDGHGWEGADGAGFGDAAAPGGSMAPWQMPPAAAAADAQRRRRSSVGGWGVDEDEEEGGGYQLLRVAHKVEAVGINYSRTAKQVGGL